MKKILCGIMPVLGLLASGCNGDGKGLPAGITDPDTVSDNCRVYATVVESMDGFFRHEQEFDSDSLVFTKTLVSSEETVIDRWTYDTLEDFVDETDNMNLGAHVSYSVEIDFGHVESREYDGERLLRSITAYEDPLGERLIIEFDTWDEDGRVTRGFARSENSNDNTFDCNGMEFAYEYDDDTNRIVEYRSPGIYGNGDQCGNNTTTRWTYDIYRNVAITERWAGNADVGTEEPDSYTDRAPRVLGTATVCY